MKSPKLNKILIFTDGACSGNPGPGGWGAIVLDTQAQVTELGGRDPATTNNRMELTGALKALAAVAKDPHPISLYTDSTYLIRGITQWIWGWRKNGWRNGEGEEVANRDLWEDLFQLLMARGSKGKIEWHYSRGHVGTPGNERCDEIAVEFSKGRFIPLYSGPLLQYSVPILDLPENTELPPMQEKKAKVPAYSYLSYLNGEVWRHRDWGSCERRVKGQSGAKFKKAMSASDEAEILKAWGLPADFPVRE